MKPGPVVLTGPVHHYDLKPGDGSAIHDSAYREVGHWHSLRRLRGSAALYAYLDRFGGGAEVSPRPTPRPAP